eukprot:11595862-Alexandrium_andersonii.AAC.1
MMCPHPPEVAFFVRTVPLAVGYSNGPQLPHNMPTDAGWYSYCCRKVFTSPSVGRILPHVPPCKASFGGFGVVLPTDPDRDDKQAG